MTANLNPEDIAKFLLENPDFFHQYAEVFADLKVPSPDSGTAIPLVQRQLLTLREQNHTLKSQLTGLIENASGNQRISHLLIQWCSIMLAENNANEIPHQITQGIANIFELSDISLKLWGLEKYTTTQEANTEITDLKKFTNNHKKPICGPVAINLDIAALLPTHTQSMAVIPLRLSPNEKSIGLLILGSPDANRFTQDMGVDFLETIAALASAALSRLSDTEQKTA